MDDGASTNGWSRSAHDPARQPTQRPPHGPRVSGIRAPPPQSHLHCQTKLAPVFVPFEHGQDLLQILLNELYRLGVESRARGRLHAARLAMLIDLLACTFDRVLL